MSHRLQIRLEDRQYVALQRASESTGRPIAELIRRAIATLYDSYLDTEQRLVLLDAGFAAWTDRSDSEDAHEAWRSLRPALGA
jgi:hypothetical protein